MTIGSSTRTAGPFIGNGVQTAFPFTFKVFQTSDLLATQVDTNLVLTTLALSTNYTVALNADQNVAPGGTLTTNVALPNLYALTLSSAVPNTQPASIPNLGGFNPRVIEDSLDRLTILLQQSLIGSGQNLRVPELAGVAVLASAGTRANMYLGFDASGAPFLFSGSPSLVTTITASGNASIGGTLIVNNTTTLKSDSGHIAQMLTSAGYAGWRVFNQAAARIAEFIAFGSANAGAYGIAPGMAGINTPASVDLSLGVNDAVVIRLRASTGTMGLGMSPVATKGMLQLLGSSTGGIQTGNVNNVDATAFDWYEEGPWTPQLRFNLASVGMTFGTQTGWFTRQGNMVDARMRIVLTNKGSSSGTATIAGLPYAAAAATASIPEFIPMEFGLMTAISSLLQYGLSGAPGTSVLTVVGYQLDGAASVPLSLTHTQFGSGSIIDGSFRYQAV